MTRARSPSHADEMPAVDLSNFCNVPEPLLLLPFFLVTIVGNAMTAMAPIADRLLHCGE
jgi:hypothetical protein